MIGNKLSNSPDFLSAETTASLQTNRSEPELCFAVIALDMDVSWFSAIPGIEKKPLGANSKYRRHLFDVTAAFLEQPVKIAPPLF